MATSMDGTTLQQLRDQLLARRRQITGDMEREREAGSMADMNGNSAEIIDIAQSLEQIDREKSLAEQNRRELLAIERALAKLATGSFGICEECDEEITIKRMLVIPAARLCARCQALEERQNVRVRNVSAAIR